MISGAQIRAARLLLGWTARGLARKANVAVFTVEAVEQDRFGESATHPGIAVIRAALAAEGIAFTNEAPGARLEVRRQSRFRHPRAGSRRS
jgi:transcriptional regulator with XRE-family HTH domain